MEKVLHYVPECLKCHGESKGYKCELCGMEYEKRDYGHVCGFKHCMPMCARCGQAESNCECTIDK